MSRRRRCRVLSGRSECQLPLPAAPRPSTDIVASNALLTDATEGRTDLSFIRSHSLAICDHVPALSCASVAAGEKSCRRFN